MSHIYREMHEILIPKGAYINHSDARVFLMSDDGTGHQKRQVIGIAASDKTMHPNTLFKYLYPELWKNNYGGNNLPEHELHIGMYASALGIGTRTGLYQILHETYGPLYGNAIMDYCMYSILNRTDTTQLYFGSMVNQVKFSDETHDDTWYSNLFKRHMSANANHQFRISWLKNCAERGSTKAWICMDGSNNDSALSNSNLAEKGNAKSHTNTDIVSYIWAVSADDGTPLTYFVNNGGMVDSKAFQTMVAFLKSAGIETSGVILDRGFCNHDTITELDKLGYPYVAMLKSNTYAHGQMVTAHSEDIRWKAEYVVNDKGIFGMTGKYQLFGQYPETANIGLYYDGINGGEGSVKLIQKILKAKSEADTMALAGNRPTFPPKLSSYFVTGQSGDGAWCVSYNYNSWQKALDSNGFYSIATSADLDAKQLYDTYYLRDASEKQFMIMKSQLGFDTTRVHSDQSVESKFAVCFAASIIRTEMLNACKRLGADTNTMILNLSRIVMVLMVDGVYRIVNNISGRQLEILKAFGIKPEYFKWFADDANRRINNSINSRIHRLPDDPDSLSSTRKRGRPPKKKDRTSEEVQKRKSGRPKGSKNRKTLEKENVVQVGDPIEKRKPGRPIGSKNRSKESLKNSL